MPKRYFVTRHRGAVTWAARNGLRARKVETSNFDPAVLQPGDVVMGILPMHLVAEVNRRGGHYWNLTMDVPPEWRGRELTAEEMTACHARLEEFRVLQLGPRTEHMGTPEVWDETDAGDRPALHLCIATGQQLPNAATIRLTPWDRVAIFASPRMRESADRLAAYVRDEARRRGHAAGEEALRYPLPEHSQLPAVRAAVQTALRDLRAQFPQHRLVLNITGGLKLMTLGFADVLRAQARILYCDAERGVIETVEPEGVEPIPLGPELDIDAYLRVQGFVVRSGGRVDDAQRRRIEARRRLTATLALKLVDLASDLRARFHSLDGASQITKGSGALLHALAARAVETGRRGRFEPLQRATLDANQSLGAVSTALLDHLSDAGLLTKRTRTIARPPQVGGGVEVEVELVFADADAAHYVAGGYLEEFTWLSARAAGLPDSHVALNAHLDPLLQRAARKTDTLNEIDVAVTWNARMLFIECKAGRQLRDGLKSQPILNKAAAIRDGMGGSQAESWIVGNASLSTTDEADIRARAKVLRLAIRTGEGELARMPTTMAEWARLPPPAFDWKDEILPLAAPGKKAVRKKRG